MPNFVIAMCTASEAEVRNERRQFPNSRNLSFSLRKELKNCGESTFISSAHDHILRNLSQMLLVGIEMKSSVSDEDYIDTECSIFILKRRLVVV
jgi:hypothetical protein